jgi:hypothetical protein
MEDQKTKVTQDGLFFLKSLTWAERDIFFQQLRVLLAKKQPKR